MLYGSRVSVGILCKILDSQKKCVSTKTFTSSQLLSNPKNPILNSNFISFELRKLFDRSSIRIGNWFRLKIGS